MERSASVIPPVPFRSTVAEASANPIRYCRAMPRLEPQDPPPAVELGWLVLKNVVPETVVALDTTFSPAARLTFQPFNPSGSVPSTMTLVASNTLESEYGLPEGAGEKPEIFTDVLLKAPVSGLPGSLELRSLNM